MNDERKDITLAEVADAQRKGLDFILDNLEVTAVVTIKDKHGNVKSKVKVRNDNEPRGHS